MFRALMLFTVIAAPVWAQGFAPGQMLSNTNALSLPLREAPGQGMLVVGRAEPGEVGVVQGCAEGGSWCFVDFGEAVGWADMSAMLAGQGRAPSSVPVVRDPVPEVTTRQLPPPITVSPLDQAVDPSIADDVRAALARTAPRDPLPSPHMIDWRDFWTPEMIYVNRGDGRVNLREGPSTDLAVVGSLEPGEGGRVRTCDPFAGWCQLSLDSGGRGWVRMDLVVARAF
ncbi:SH3 domain-containing protein [Jannaschia aquimarina]|uniref:Bacterial SH3 domain protein n=1 Tax=Jannaschia aquimarina TaxID=935700 RepID=A0A0D1CRN7_9RHOB|nr:SH3 domain-containing protein [Jannaschia aquimarina]KIT17457.1 Bacterial SH3 domain protein [Jannaschia aquimarina]SNS75586.1 SH3 domain-containing protein [Jannaschia aquimarina]